MLFAASLSRLLTRQAQCLDCFTRPSTGIKIRDTWGIAAVSCLVEFKVVPVYVRKCLHVISLDRPSSVILMKFRFRLISMWLAVCSRYAPYFSFISGDRAPDPPWVHCPFCGLPRPEVTKRLPKPAASNALLYYILPYDMVQTRRKNWMTSKAT